MNCKHESISLSVRCDDLGQGNMKLTLASPITDTQSRQQAVCFKPIGWRRGVGTAGAAICTRFVHCGLADWNFGGPVMDELMEIDMER